MSDPTLLEWREVAPGVFERHIDAAEQFYTTMSKVWEGTGHTFFAINAAVDFTVNDQNYMRSHTDLSNLVIASLWHAWKQLRYQFPTIASQVLYDPETKTCRKVYQSPQSDDELEDWMHETFFVSDDLTSPRDLANQDEPLGRFATLHLLRTEPSLLAQNTESSDHRFAILFRSHHDIIDGVGTLVFLNHLFDAAAEAFVEQQPIDWGDEYEGLSPALQVAARIPVQPTADQLAKFLSVRENNSKARENHEIIGFPLQTSTNAPGRSQQAGIKLSTRDTTKVLRICKQFGITATHLIHAAIALALRDIQPRTDQQRAVRYISYALIDLRNICAELGEPELNSTAILHGVSSNHLILDLIVPALSQPESPRSKTERLSVLAQVRDFYKSNVVDENFLATALTAYQAVTPPYPEESLPIPASDSSGMVNLSSLGLIDRLIHPRHGPFTIFDPWVIGAEYKTGLGVFLGTYDGEMSLWAAYNETYYQETTTVAFLEKVTDVAFSLLEALGGNGSEMGQ